MTHHHLAQVNSSQVNSKPLAEPDCVQWLESQVYIYLVHLACTNKAIKVSFTRQRRWGGGWFGGWNERKKKVRKKGKCDRTKRESRKLRTRQRERTEEIKNERTKSKEKSKPYPIDLSSSHKKMRSIANSHKVCLSPSQSLEGDLTKPPYLLHPHSSSPPAGASAAAY